MDDYIDYTTIARLLRDAGISADRIRFLIRLLAMPNRELLQWVKMFTINAATSSDRLSGEELTTLRSALGNPVQCHEMQRNVP